MYTTVKLKNNIICFWKLLRPRLLLVNSQGLPGAVGRCNE